MIAAAGASSRYGGAVPKPWLRVAGRSLLEHGLRALLAALEDGEADVEEVLENRIGFYPTYGNTLMGLAASVPLTPEDKFSITYYAPQPRAVLRIVNPDKPEETMPYGEYGRVELTTMTKEFFMPRFLERDECEREQPCHARTLLHFDGGCRFATRHCELA